MVVDDAPDRPRRTTRRRFLGATAATAAAVSGTTNAAAGQPGRGGDGAPPDHAGKPDVDLRCGVPEDAEDPVVAAIERNAIPLEFGEGSIHLCDIARTATHLVDGPALGRILGSRRLRREPERLAHALVAATLSEASIVGMGEATHGTHEFHVIRRRLVEELVAEHDCRVLAFETSFSEVVPVNDYVVHGEGSVDDALGSISSWLWSTADVRSLFQWLRAFNEGRPREERVEIHGIDCQYPDSPAEALGAYFETVDPAFLDDLEPALSEMAASSGGHYYFEDEAIDPGQIETVRDVADAVTAQLDDRRTEYVEEASERAWTMASRHARTLAQSAALYEVWADPEGRAFEKRDEMMAANATWLSEELETDQVVVWAHNDHVRVGRVPPNDERTMGWFLDDAHGQEYYSLGFDFATGSFTALSSPDDDTLGTETFDEPEAPASATLAETNASALFLDLEYATDDSTLADWLDEPRELSSVGAIVHPEFRSDAYDLTAEYDGLVHVAETTATTVLDHPRLPEE